MEWCLGGNLFCYREYTWNLVKMLKKKYLGITIIFLGIFLSFLIVGKAVKSVKKPKLTSSNLYEASFYRKLENGRVQCELCPNKCLLKTQERGICKSRENIGGKLYSLVYGKPVTVHVDPIEKKPFYHFLPGAKAYSLATTGCNLSCKYCQNWDISQRNPEEVESTPMTPEEVVQKALQSGSPVIAFTYNEPVIWYEYVRDIAKLAKQKGLRTVMISNGYINQEPLKELLMYLDGVKVDLKAFDDEVYQKMSNGRLTPVLETIKTVHASGKWLEIVYLVVPQYTDNQEKIKEMCLWVLNNVGEEVPIHFSRFWPEYKLANLPPTPPETIKQARQICLELGMKYVYTGNISDQDGSTTYCPGTQQPVIKRDGFLIKENLVDNLGLSEGCPSSISGVWQ